MGLGDGQDLRVGSQGDLVINPLAPPPPCEERAGTPVHGRQSTARGAGPNQTKPDLTTPTVVCCSTDRPDFTDLPKIGRTRWTLLNGRLWI